ncbi:hypothetical protein G7046_g6777 [Stylonectria norvegica]|nr:hypothetical protein G7046_g6777 [Stylonectria norvegica]
MAESNGSLEAGSATTSLNGNHLNGNHLNGKQLNGTRLNGKMNCLNGQALGRRRRTKRKRSFLYWAVNLVSRLTTWAAILIILFRCPSSLEACDEASPYICKPYFQTKNAIVPHVQPFYDQYAAPYVEIARPYYDTVDAKVWKPTRAYAVQYGAPWVQSGREHAWAQWEKNGQPQLTKVQDLARVHYSKSVAPYVNQAGSTVGPYYEIARTNALQVFYEFLLPSYEFVQPYAVHSYGVASDFTTGTAIPTAHWAWNKTYFFLDTTVWPHLRAVYLENVEPQLVRIGERLGRYKIRDDAKTAQESFQPDSFTDSTYSTFSKPAPQSSSTVLATVEESTVTESVEPEATVEEYSNPVQAPPAGDNESDKRRNAREIVAEDLEKWQNKFAAQADEGASDMEERVEEIAKRMIHRSAEVTGKELFEELESTIQSELNNLKSKISSLVESADSNSEQVEQHVVAAVRSSGKAIKQKAYAIREWRESYDNELQSAVVGAADIHFQMLDETRNLALQQIGMRWAWTDGVTYKDWAKYHELKSTLSDWTEQLKQLIVSHPTLLEAQEASARVEDEGMEIASVAAKELARLKEVAHWKLTAKDATDNFESEAMRQAAEAVEAAEKVAAAEASKIAEYDANDVAEKISGATQDAASMVSSTLDQATVAAAAAFNEAQEVINDYASTVAEPVKEATSSIVSVGSAASSIASDSIESGFSDVSSLVSEGTETVGSYTDGISSSVVDISSTAFENKETLSSVADGTAATAEALSDDAASELSEVISAATESTQSVSGSLNSFVSEASEFLANDALPVASNNSEDPVLIDDNDSIGIEQDPLTQRDETPINEEPVVKPAFIGGAMAQAVSDRQPILEDYVDTDAISSVTGAAGSAYSNAVSKASEQYLSAASVISAQMYGTPKPVHEQLLSSVSAAYDNAVAAASAKLSDAADAVSSVTPATPTLPTLVDWERVESIASQRLEEGRLWAEIQYQSAMIALGLATPTPSSSMEKYYEQAKFNYYAGLGVAQDRYSSFLAGASSALSSYTATPTPTDFAGTASSLASVARESASSAAKAAGDAAGSAYSAAGDSAAYAGEYAGDAAGSVYAAAGDSIASVGDAAGSAYSAAGESIASATDAAGSAVSAAGDTIASAAQAVDDTISSVVDAANEQISAAGEALADSWVNVVAQISGQVYGEEPSQIAWYENIFSDANAYAAAATEAVGDKASAVSDAAGSSAVTASAEASKQYDAVSKLVSELINGREPTFSESVLARLQAAYGSASASVESFASEASEAASSMGDKVGSVASQATEAVKETAEHLKDEL